MFLLKFVSFLVLDALTNHHFIQTPGTVRDGPPYVREPPQERPFLFTHETAQPVQFSPRGAGGLLQIYMRSTVGRNY